MLAIHLTHKFDHVGYSDLVVCNECSAPRQKLRMESVDWKNMDCTSRFWLKWKVERAMCLASPVLNLKSTKAITWGVERPCLTARLSPTARNTPLSKKICIGGGSMSRWNLLLLLLLLLRSFSCCCPPSATSSTLPPPPGVLSVCWCRPCWTSKEPSVVETDLMFCLWHDEW